MPRVVAPTTVHRRLRAGGDHSPPTPLAAWRTLGRPVVFVRHDSSEADSPLRPGQAGNELKPLMTGEPDLLVTKCVHSCFHGAPDLDRWLHAQGHILGAEREAPPADG